MKFQIQLPEDFRAKYVTIELGAEATVDDPSTQPLAKKYATVEQAERAALNADRTMQRNRAELAEAKLEKLIGRNADLAGQLAMAQEAREIETKRAQDYDQDRRSERDRAGAKIAHLEVKVTTLETNLAEAMDLLTERTGQLNVAKMDLVESMAHDHGVIADLRKRSADLRDAMARICRFADPDAEQAALPSARVRDYAERLRRIRAITREDDLVGPPAPPVEGTSQA